MLGYDFHRQKPIADFIVDFFAPELMLAIEIDGSSHREKAEYDAGRQRQIEAFGVSFLRFEESDVVRDLPQVLRAIEGWIDQEERSLERRGGR